MSLDQHMFYGQLALTSRHPATIHASASELKRLARLHQVASITRLRSSCGSTAAVDWASHTAGRALAWPAVLC